MNKIMKRLKVFLIISLCIVISYWITLDTPELFNGAGKIFEFIEHIAEAYIASFIFFYVVQYLYYVERKKIAEKHLDIILYRISFNMSELVSFILIGLGENIKRENEVLDFNIDTLGVNKKFMYTETNIGSFFVGSKFMMYADFSPEKIFQMIVNSINMNINRLENYFEFYNDELVELLLNIRYSDLLESVSTAANKDVLVKTLDARVDEVKSFYNIYLEFIEFMRKNDFPIESMKLSSKYKEVKS